MIDCIQMRYIYTYQLQHSRLLAVLCGGYRGFSSEPKLVSYTLKLTCSVMSCKHFTLFYSMMPCLNYLILVTVCTFLHMNYPLFLLNDALSQLLDFGHGLILYTICSVISLIESFTLMSYVQFSAMFALIFGGPLLSNKY